MIWLWLYLQILINFLDSSDIFKVTPVTRVNGLTAELVDEISENYLLIGGLHEDKTPAKTQIFYKGQEWCGKYVGHKTNVLLV